MSMIEQALSEYNSGFNCAQAVLVTYGAQLGLNREMALRVAGAFGSGMAQMGEVCGAVSGALMVIGLKYGKTSAEDEPSRIETYSLAKEFVQRFKDRHGSIMCRDLVGCDLSTDDGMADAEERDLFSTVCPAFVRDSAEIVEQML